MDEKSKWCNSFIIGPKCNGTVAACVDPAGLNQELIRAIHRVSTPDDILHKQTNVHHVTIIDASAGYHNLKLNKNFTYLTTLHFKLVHTDSPDYHLE